MRNIAFIASLICCLVLPDMVSAMPVASGDTVAKAANTQIVPARGGCDAVPADIAGHTAAAGGTAGNSNGNPSAPADGFLASLAA